MNKRKHASLEIVRYYAEFGGEGAYSITTFLSFLP